MGGYLGNFLGSWEQVPLLLCVGAVWLLLALLGAGGGGRGRLAEADPLVGWAVAVLVVTLGGVWFRIPFTPLAAGLGILALGLYGWRLYRGAPGVWAPGGGRLLLLLAPLLVLTSAMAPSQWDEFSHWLASARYLLETDGFPTAADPETGASFPAYPYAWPLLSYLAGRLGGGFMETAGALFNLLLLASFALLAVRLMRQGAERDTEAAPPWGLLALGGLAATLLNPTFVQKVVLTAYADVATAATVAFGAVLGWAALGAVAAGDPARARRLAWRAGLVLAVLVSLKQATLVLFVLVVGGVLVVAMRDRAVPWRALPGLAFELMAPAVLVYLVWRHHVATEIPGREFVIQPMSEWLLAELPEILARMGLVFAKKGAYTALMVIATGFGIVGLVRMRGPLDRLAVIVAGLFVGYNAFMLFAYVTAFGKYEALRAASLWRYNQHLGLAGVAFAVFALGLAWRRWGADRPVLSGPWPGRVALVLLVAAPFAFAGKLRFDREWPKPHYWRVARAVADTIPAADQLVVLDPQGNGESAIITLYALGRHAPKVVFLSAIQGTEPERIRRVLDTTRPRHVLVHTLSPGVSAVFGPNLKDGTSVLLDPDGAGGWTPVAHWDWADSR